MKKFFSNLLMVVLFFTIILVPCKVYGADKKSPCKPINCRLSTDLKLNQRKLWGDHVLWTRNFIISDLAGLEDKSKVLERLLKNQDDIGDSLKLYYGEENGKKIAQLLKEHITIAGQVVEAAKSGNKDNLVKYNKVWTENADKIAEFLCALNPKWCDDELKNMLHKHLQLVASEVVARLSKDWDMDIISYDKGEEHIFKLADTISEGIIGQFPAKF